MVKRFKEEIRKEEEGMKCPFCGSEMNFWLVNCTAEAMWNCPNCGDMSDFLIWTVDGVSHDAR